MSTPSGLYIDLDDDDTVESTRVDLDCPYDQKEEVKKFGAQFDYEKKVWYAPDAQIAKKCRKWLPKEIILSIPPSLVDFLKKRGAEWCAKKKKWVARGSRAIASCEQWKAIEGKQETKSEKTESGTNSKKRSKPSETNSSSTDSNSKQEALQLLQAKRAKLDQDIAKAERKAKAEAKYAKMTLFERAHNLGIDELTLFREIIIAFESTLLPDGVVSAVLTMHRTTHFHLMPWKGTTKQRRLDILTLVSGLDRNIIATTIQEHYPSILWQHVVLQDMKDNPKSYGKTTFEEALSIMQRSKHLSKQRTRALEKVDGTLKLVWNTICSQSWFYRRHELSVIKRFSQSKNEELLRCHVEQLASAAKRRDEFKPRDLVTCILEYEVFIPGLEGKRSKWSLTVVAPHVVVDPTRVVSCSSSSSTSSSKLLPKAAPTTTTSTDDSKKEDDEGEDYVSFLPHPYKPKEEKKNKEEKKTTNWEKFTSDPPHGYSFFNSIYMESCGGLLSTICRAAKTMPYTQIVPVSRELYKEIWHAEAPPASLYDSNHVLKLEPVCGIRNTNDHICINLDQAIGKLLEDIDTCTRHEDRKNQDITILRLQLTNVPLPRIELRFECTDWADDHVTRRNPTSVDDKLPVSSVIGIESNHYMKEQYGRYAVHTVENKYIDHKEANGTITKKNISSHNISLITVRVLGRSKIHLNKTSSPSRFSPDSWSTRQSPPLNITGYILSCFGMPSDVVSLCLEYALYEHVYLGVQTVPYSTDSELRLVQKKSGTIPLIPSLSLSTSSISNPPPRLLASNYCPLLDRALDTFSKTPQLPRYTSLTKKCSNPWHIGIHPHSSTCIFV